MCLNQTHVTQKALCSILFRELSCQNIWLEPKPTMTSNAEHKDQLPPEKCYCDEDDNP